MKVLVIYIPLIFLAFAYGYNRKYHRLIHSGRVPDIISANNRAKLFILLAVLSFVLLIIRATILDK